ncbi:uncharacterized protein il4r.2 isoform X1 [Myxocyprinus asiaticus]|uniref:uncharacterized protein il4r.2 isoform X1 n=1 Tax=Myxocyprinus asiaticus TaxID=70543 RepID=UPI002221D064|nr:uncharacterized protein il4r.2 isoform X1 [Myxocyprinus asiaticus]
MYFTALCSQIVLMLLCHALCYEPAEEDFSCFNDYEREMKCSLSSKNLINCSEYKLNTTHTVLEELNKYTCIFERSHHNASVCECKFEIPGFVPMEIFCTTLLQGVNVLFTKNFSTLEFIKPKTPAILSVQKTPNGDFKVTWDNKYKDKTRYFAQSLSIELTYGIKGGKDTVSKMVMDSMGFYEIVGRNLQPNTDYILTARVKTNYNNNEIFSDRSTPYEFTTSPSLSEILKIVIPGVCVGLIIIIFIIFICFFRIKRMWWDKITKPEIDPNLGKQKGHMLPPSNMKFSPVVVEIPKLDLQEEKKWLVALSEDTNNEQSFNSVDSTHSVDYGQACSGIQEQNMSILTRTMLALQELPLLPTNTVIPSKSLDIGSQRESNSANRDSGNGSGSSFLRNNSYLESSVPDDSSFLDISFDPSYQSYKREFFNPDPVDCLKTQLNSAIVEDGYQDIGNVNHANGSSDVNEKFIMKNLITSKNPLYPCLTPHDDGITPSSDCYQDFQSLSKNTGEQWSPTTCAEIALGECGALKIPQTVLGTDHTPTSVQQSSWTSSLHISPCIQMDSSYHSV